MWKSVSRKLICCQFNQDSRIVLIPQNGFLSTLPYIGQFLMAFPVSAASAYLLERDVVSKVNARKIFNSMSYFGAAAGLIWLAFVGCNSGQGVESSVLGNWDK